MATVKVNKNIDFLVDEHGNLVGSRNPRSQTSSDSNYSDTSLVTSKVNAVTGGISLSASGESLTTAVFDYKNAIYPAVGPSGLVTSGGSLVADWADCTDTLGNSATRSASVDGNGTTRSFNLNSDASGSYVDLVGFPSFDLIDTKNLVFWFFAPAGQAQERIVRILMSTTPGGAYTKYFEVVCSFPSIGAWVPVCVPRGSWTANGSATWDAAVTSVRFRASDSGVTYGYPVLAAAETITCGSMLKNAVTKAALMISMDDAHTSINTWRTLLDGYGYAATTYVYPRQLGYVSRATINDLRRCKNSGWLIGNHSFASPDDAANNSLKNLGPVGRGVAISSYGTNVINVSANRAPAAQIISSIKIVSGSTPAGVSLNTKYWARNVTASSIAIYTNYDSANLADVSGLVTFTTGASTAGTFDYWDSELDSTGIRADLESAADRIRSWGFGDDGLHVALPQGAYDANVVRALRNFGARTVRMATAYSGSGDAVCRIPAGYAARRNGTIEPTGTWATFPGVCDFDGKTSAQIIAFIDSLIDLGGSAHLYSHTTPDETKLATVVAYLKSKSDQIVVTTPDKWLDL
jgi:hypothetical protein